VQCASMDEWKCQGQLIFFLNLYQTVLYPVNGAN
jgi:hypothetical protein